MTGNTYLDGKLCQNILADDRGFVYGHGLFETMRLWQGTLPLLDRHLTRLASGAKRLVIPCNVEALKVQLGDILPKFAGEGLVKLILTAGDAPRGYRYHPADSESKPRCLVQYFEPVVGVENITLQLCQYRLPHNPALAGVKHLNRLDQVIAAMELPSSCDGLLLDQSGQVVEALSSNIFLLYQDQWLTPSLDSCGVAGVMRDLLVAQLMPALGIKPKITDISLGILGDADEVFICNAVNGITPVAEVVGSEGRGTMYKPTPTRFENQTSLISAELARQYSCFAK